MCNNYGATEVKSLTIYMGGLMYTRHHEQSLTLPLALGVAHPCCLYARSYQAFLTF